MSHHITPYHIMSHHLYRITPHHIMSYHTTSPGGARLAGRESVPASACEG